MENYNVKEVQTAMALGMRVELLQPGWGNCVAACSCRATHALDWSRVRSRTSFTCIYECHL